MAIFCVASRKKNREKEKLLQFCDNVKERAFSSCTLIVKIPSSALNKSFMVCWTVIVVMTEAEGGKREEKVERNMLT